MSFFKTLFVLIFAVLGAGVDIIYNRKIYLNKRSFICQTKKNIKETNAKAEDVKQTNVKSEEVKGELTYEDKVIQKIIGLSLEKVNGLLAVDGGFSL